MSNANEEIKSRATIKNEFWSGFCGRGTKLDSWIRNLNLPPPSTSLDTEVTSIFARGGRDLGSCAFFLLGWVTQALTQEGPITHQARAGHWDTWQESLPKELTLGGCAFGAILLHSWENSPGCHSSGPKRYLFLFGGPETPLHSLITDLILQLTS